MTVSNASRFSLRSSCCKLVLISLVVAAAGGCREPASALEALHAQVKQTRSTLGPQLQAAREEVMRLANLPSQVRDGQGQQLVSRADTACTTADLELKGLDRTLPAVAARPAKVVRTAAAELGVRISSVTAATQECLAASRQASDVLNKAATEALAAQQRAAAEDESARAYQDSLPRAAKEEPN